MKDRVIITQGQYVASAVKKDQYPEADLPEIVFIGRSNVGKSSLINSLTRVNNLARVSSQPGKTQTINFFEVGVKIAEVEERKAFYLVDLPGYGYAKTVIDSRHEPMASDVDMFNWLVDNGIPVLIIATKVDKIGKNERAKNIAAIKRKLGIKEISVLPYSSLKNEGRSDLLDVIGDSLLE